MRGVAAFAVLLWHYQHFYMGAGLALPDVTSLDLPLQSVLAPLYSHGHLGVPLFWTISGFVFATAYRGSKATTRDFIVARIARLYPLHFVTLLVVASLQSVALWQVGSWLIYGNNDPLHFVGQLLYIGGHGAAASFNGPIWSVSVELLIYAVFWLFHGRLERRGLLGSVAIAAIFAALFKFAGGNVALCGIYFFLGCACATFHFMAAPVHRCWACVALFSVGGMLFHVWGDSGPFKNGVPPLSMALVLALASAESAAPSALRRACSAIGDCSYGLYLWHIPVQLVLLLVFRADTSAVASHTWFLVLFLSATLICAVAGYQWIERPARDMIKRMAVNRAAALA